MVRPSPGPGRSPSVALNAPDHHIPKRREVMGQKGGSDRPLQVGCADRLHDRASVEADGDQGRHGRDQGMVDRRRRRGQRGGLTVRAPRRLWKHRRSAVADQLTRHSPPAYPLHPMPNSDYAAPEKQFGMLRIINLDSVGKRARAQCACGVVVEIAVAALTCGSIVSCCTCGGHPRSPDPSPIPNTRRLPRGAHSRRRTP
jgi:hypothetical protein